MSSSDVEEVLVIPTRLRVRFANEPNRCFRDNSGMCKFKNSLPICNRSRAYKPVRLCNWSSLEENVFDSVWYHVHPLGACAKYPAEQILFPRSQGYQRIGPLMNIPSKFG